jgi:hypothetical protein
VRKNKICALTLLVIKLGTRERAEILQGKEYDSSINELESPPSCRKLSFSSLSVEARDASRMTLLQTLALR